MIASLCRAGESSFLFALARGGSSKQRLAFFRLLLSLPKRSGSDVLDASDFVTTIVAEAACGMLKDAPDVGAAGAVGVDGSSGSFGGLWLLVLGRCCMQWAAALHQVQGQVVSWAQVMQQAQQEAVEGRVVTGVEAATLRMAPWLIKGRELRLHLAEHRAVVTDLIGLLAQGSSLAAGLSAAGYAVGPIVQGLEALSVCYSRVVVQTQHVPADSDVVERVSGLIKGLEFFGSGAECVCCAALLQQPAVCQHQRAVRGKHRVWQGLHLCRLQGGAPLWQALSGGALEGGAQACVQHAVPGCASGHMRGARHHAGRTTQPCAVLGSPGLDSVV